MTRDSIFRIYSMTKPIVSVGIMQLVEDGHLLLSEPLTKYIPEFSALKVGVENNGKLDLVPPARPITIQDLLRHTSGLTNDTAGNGPVQRMYQQSQDSRPQHQQCRTRGHRRRDAAALPARRGMELQPLHRHSGPHHRNRFRQIAWARI